MMTITSWVVTLVTVNLSLQSILQISLGAKDAATAKKGFVWGGIIMLPVGVLAAFLGICAKAMYPDAQAALALPEVIVSLQPVQPAVIGWYAVQQRYLQTLHQPCGRRREADFDDAPVCNGQRHYDFGVGDDGIQHFGYDYDRTEPDGGVQRYRYRGAVLP